MTEIINIAQKTVFVTGIIIGFGANYEKSLNLD